MGKIRKGPVALLLQPTANRRGARKRPALDAAWRMICMTAFVLLAASIFYLGERPVAIGLFPAPYDKVVHFTTFFLLTVLLGFAGLRAFPLTLLLVGLALGALDELHQMFLPGRIGSWQDFLADVSAVLAAVLLMLAIYKRNRRPGSDSPFLR